LIDAQNSAAGRISPDPDTTIARPIMRQSWRHVSFLHWRCDPAAVRKLIPRELELDLFEGDCWVGLVPFLIEDLTTPKGPALPWLSRFPETNVRSYVIDREGRRGVWFHSLDAARWPAVVGARLGFGLPYHWARMSVNRQTDRAYYGSKRLTPPGGRCRLEIAIGDPIPVPSPLEVFLTARFRLFARRLGRGVMAEISHQRWPLQRGRVCAMEQNLVAKAGIPQSDSLPLTHFAAGVDVIVGPPRRITP
jgi:hypothetical protein